MGTVPDQSIFEALRGNTVECLKHPTPRLVKIYISSTKQGELKSSSWTTEWFYNVSFFQSRRVQRGEESASRSHRTRTSIDLWWQTNWGWQRFLNEVKALESSSLQIELVDMHFGTGLTHTTVDLDPYVLYDHLREIKNCFRASRSVFFIVSGFSTFQIFHTW